MCGPGAAYSWGWTVRGGFLEGAFAFSGLGVWEQRVDLGVEHFLGIWQLLLGRVFWHLEESGILVVIAVCDGAEEREFLGIFCNFAHVFVFQECFSHFSKFSPLCSLAGFGIVFGVGEIELGAAFSAEEAVIDVLEELFDCLLVGGTLFITGQE